MSTIASPRETSLPPSRRIASITPTSSTRPSLEAARSLVGSPVNASHPHAPVVAKRSNRAALREYYKLRAGVAGIPRIEVSDSEVPASDLDVQEFKADEYISKVSAESSMEDLLKLYTRVVGEVRALDAEKKALVYDNYSKLISATETIQKMRSNMDPLNPMASTLNPAITQIYNQANSIREELRESIPAPGSDEAKQQDAKLQRQRLKQVAAEVLATPEKLRSLIAQGRTAEAMKQWELPRKLLVIWKDKEIGGSDVQHCIDEGDGILQAAVEEPTSNRTSRDSR